MQQSFGARMRQRREEQGVRLGTIADHTKIKLSLLEALERDDVSHWPTGIFRRAYIRAYAQAINLDPDVALRAFLDAYPEPQEVFETALASALAAGGRTAPPTRLRTMVGSALESLSRLRRPATLDYEAVERANPLPELIPADLPTVHPPEVLAAVEMADDAPAALMSEELERADELEDATAIKAPPVVAPVVSFAPDLVQLARVCTALGQVAGPEEIQPHLDAAARAIGAVGLIVWIWDETAQGLRPALAHGYSPRVLAQLPTVLPDDDNATAAAFRSARACTMPGAAHSSGALVVPLLLSTGCVGVLALELLPQAERETAVRAAATIAAAALAQLVARSTVDSGAESFEPRRAGSG
jgi:hypothetical protein